ncbi:MAG: hypothetical protein KIS92_17060 [Planctomycetota bacterium]|nr:hypothetical protein [Planctomycetota bacterium]
MLTEVELDRLLKAGILRVRLTAALRAACLGLGIGLALAAVLTALARLYPVGANAAFAVAMTLPPLLLAVAAAVGFSREKPSLLRVALRLDQSARLHEHLSTYVDLRTRAKSGDALADAFVEAQRLETLRQADGLSAGRHLPLRLPEWARALLLGVLALGCALLMPERVEPMRAKASDNAAAGTAAPNGPANPGEAPALDSAEHDTPFQVQPISPTEMYQAQLATLPNVPEAMKKHWLDEIERKKGSLTDRELTPDVRELLDTLRRQVGKDKEAAAEDGGSQRAEPAGGTPESAGDRPPAARELALPPPGRAEDLVGAAQDRFPDVAQALERYYAAGPDGRKP